MPTTEIRAPIGVVLILIGAAVLALAAGGYLQSPFWQHVQAEPIVPPAAAVRRGALPAPGSRVARLRIPRIHLDVPIIEGTKPEDLLKAPGHLAGSAMPGDPQNCVLAGHRDLHFRRLGELRKGDRIELLSGADLFTYQIDSTHVVAPTRQDVLDAGQEAVLTLITCYPFRYVGPAPKRYVVVAPLMGRQPLPGAR